jgi:hypothetical protein
LKQAQLVDGFVDGAINTQGRHKLRAWVFHWQPREYPEQCFLNTVTSLAEDGWLAIPVWPVARLNEGYEGTAT